MMIRRITTGIAALVMAGGALVAMAGPAAAVPTNCHINSGWPNVTANGYCARGTGEFRIRGKCGDELRYSPWTKPGKKSYITPCWVGYGGLVLQGRGPRRG